MDTKYITGIGAVDERMLILIDIEKLWRALTWLSLMMWKSW
jgi:chemotaxis signal transduction protein